jgi:carboxyl-terminal processing protease
MLKVLFVITLVALGNLFFGLVQAEVKYYVENTQKTLSGEENNQKRSEKNEPIEPLPIDQIRILVEVFHKIKKDYVEQLSDEILMKNAMKGMVENLDPHSTYLEKEKYRELQEGTSGKFGGLGIEIGIRQGKLTVISPIEGTPADTAGIKAGDQIMKIDGMPVKNLSPSNAVKKMRGEPGTSVTLSIARDRIDEILEITIIRETIKARSVRSRLLEKGYGYIRISQFQAPTGKAVHTHLKELLEKNQNELLGLVLDLRNNPGGILSSAVSVADLFLNGGLIVYTAGRIDGAKLEFQADSSDVLQGTPIITLINEGSASASEIVAGALQDRGRALIMGRRSFGKGSVQTILPMNDGSALKITTARYYTPSGRSIQAEGIEPDVYVKKIQSRKTS